MKVPAASSVAGRRWQMANTSVVYAGKFLLLDRNYCLKHNNTTPQTPDGTAPVINVNGTANDFSYDKHFQAEARTLLHVSRLPPRKQQL